MRDIGSAGASDYAPVWNQRLDILGEQNRQSTLRLLADETGGAVLVNTRDYDSFFDDLRRQPRQLLLARVPGAARSRGTPARSSRSACGSRASR